MNDWHLFTLFPTKWQCHSQKSNSESRPLKPETHFHSNLFSWSKRLCCSATSWGNILNINNTHFEKRNYLGNESKKLGWNVYWTLVLQYPWWRICNPSYTTRWLHSVISSIFDNSIWQLSSSNNKCLASYLASCQFHVTFILQAIFCTPMIN